MAKYQLLISLNLKWQISGKSNYKWSECKRLINTKTGREIKKVKNGGSIGYWIGKDFIPLKKLANFVELIPKEKCPF